jgi:HSP20 family molecular chaperone IbpA
MPKQLILLVFSLLTFFSINVYSQGQAQDMMDRFMEHRRRMMEEMEKMFEDDFFKDDFFSGPDAIIGDMGMKSRSNIEITEEHKENGDYIVYVKPLDKNIKLDIKTEKNLITISGEQVSDQEITGETSSRSFMKSSFSRSIMVPQGYTVTGPTQEGERIKFVMKPEMAGAKSQGKRRKNKRIPILKDKDDQTI